MGKRLEGKNGTLEQGTRDVNGGDRGVRDYIGGIIGGEPRSTVVFVSWYYHYSRGRPDG